MIFKEKRDKISKWINNQEGQPYPCSNQIVCCGFVSDDKWNDFVDKNKGNIKILTKRGIILTNNEKWIRVPISDCIRGYRYYKIKVDKNIDEKILDQVILPCCSTYCKEIEWI